MADYNNIDIDSMSDEEFNEYLGGFSDVTPAEEEAAAPSPEEQAAAEAVENGVTPEDVEEAGEETPSGPYRSFATEEEYNSAMNGFADDRDRDRLAQGDADAQTVARLTELANNFYGSGGLEALINDLEGNMAQQAGQELEDYRQAETDRRDLARYRAQEQEQQEAARQQEQRMSEIMAAWQRQAEYLKQRVPDFDLDAAFNDPTFAEMVSNGASVDGAYYAMQQSKQEPAPARQQVRQNANMGNVRGAGGDFTDRINSAATDAEVLSAIKRYNQNGGRF